MTEISNDLGIHAELVKGDRGIFDVVADGTLVFSKHSEGRFPKPGEVVRSLRALMEED